MTDICAVLDYDRDSGRMYWRHRPREHFPSEAVCKNWNARFSGKEAFTSINAQGYRQTNFAGRVYLGHRVAMRILTGEWPQADVDHINGIRCDNRAANLRPATRTENNWNRKAATGASRYHGVSRRGDTGKWEARIRDGGVYRNLGSFACETAAAIARDKLALALRGDRAVLNIGARHV